MHCDPCVKWDFHLKIIYLWRQKLKHVNLLWRVCMVHQQLSLGWDHLQSQSDWFFLHKEWKYYKKLHLLREIFKSCRMHVFPRKPNINNSLSTRSTDIQYQRYILVSYNLSIHCGLDLLHIDRYFILHECFTYANTNRFHNFR